MLDENLIKRKIRNIQEYLIEIEPILALEKKEILGDIRNLKTLERNFQLVVDSAISINTHFIRELSMSSANDLQGTFTVLADNEILPRDFVERFSNVVGLRNRLVHRYEEIDKKKFIRNFKKNRDDFDKYIKFINDYLEKNE